MGGQVADLGPISTSLVTTKSFYCIVRRKLAGLFRPRSTSNTIKSYIPPQFPTITTSVSPPIIIIITGITLLFFVNLYLYTMIRNWQIQQSTMITWIMGGRVSSLRPIYISPFNTNSCYLIVRQILSGIL